ncbi:MAG: hypothetical protein ACE5FN_00210 [Leptospirillia bacterium]
MAIGATTLALLNGTSRLPALTSAVLMGVMIFAIALITRWVLAPLRELAAHATGTDLPPVELAVPDLTFAVHNLVQRVAAEEDMVNVRVAERVRELGAANAGLSCLFDVVARDDLSATDIPFWRERMCGWTREGLVYTAALVKNGDASLMVTGDGREPAPGSDSVPASFLRFSPDVTSPVLETVGDWIWAGFPVRIQHGDGSKEIWALALAWPANQPPREPMVASFAAVARYIALRPVLRQTLGDRQTDDAQVA